MNIIQRGRDCKKWEIQDGKMNTYGYNNYLFAKIQNFENDIKSLEQVIIF